MAPGLDPRAPDAAGGVRIASADADLAVRGGQRRRRAVLAREPQSVANLEAVHPRQQRRDVGGGDRTVDARRDVIHAREDALLVQVRQQLADVAAQPLNLLELRLGHAEHPEMDADAVPGKIPVTSHPTTTSGRSAIVRAPSIVS